MQTTKKTTPESIPTQPARSIWRDTSSLAGFAPLAADTRADVCVIGAGIAGLTTAYMLLREGKSVVVIDSVGVGAGETGRSTAHMFPPDERFAELERGFGSAKAALVADSYLRATDCVESIVRVEQIDCGFERLDGFLFNPHGEWDAVLDDEYAVTTRLGLDVRRFERVPGLHFDTGPCLRFARQAQFHPLQYLTGLARAITRLGGSIHDHTRALDIVGACGRQTVQTGHGAVDAGAVVIATNVPFMDRYVRSGAQQSYHSYVIGLRVPKDALPRCLLWDTGKPYYYVRLAQAAPGATHEVLLVGGLDQPSRPGPLPQPQARYDEIEAWSRARFPSAGQLEYRWSGRVMEPCDGIALLGRNPMDADNVYIITGDSGNGMTHCTAGAILVTDQILGRINRWSELYSPARQPFHGGVRAPATPGARWHGPRFRPSA
ncbi:MAG: FAD-dependent oxidoreductase [Massilia sp.]|jgi:glycine/D-amino acid oxidase-like deaminating enzyme|nr:FAD-dependent oxidoreductase [Massilia sp.]MDB5952451.1 FAD-dependent oxidoreductase [Massilia sp.]